ncbi:DHA2 family efflux MFS transporter permease subunit [Bordetella petrii]|nr:DHA2 family efflux MFS transporter permease subunit [Bordetella petrii]
MSTVPEAAGLSPASAPDSAQPGNRLRRLAGTLAVSLATFMSVLDISIANVSLPAIAGDLSISPTQGTWIITSFGVANAIALPLTGWLVKRLGMVRLFTASVALFTLMSLLCAMAASIEALVTFRVLQGLMAGPMIPLCQALLLRIYPPQSRGSALTILALTTLTAPVVGPLLGGWLTDNWSWHWIFLVNVPAGVVCALVAWRSFRHEESPTQPAPVDVVGLGLLVVWVGSLQLLLDLGRHHDWFGSGLIVTLALVAAVFLAAFLIWEGTHEHPIIDLSLFRVRNFWVGSLTMSLAYALFLGNLVLLPLWLQQYMGYTATMAGVVLAPVGLLALAVAPIAGRAVASRDPRWLVSVAFVVFAAALWMRSRFNTDSDLQSMMFPSLVQGIGNALFFVPLLAIILFGLPAERIASASGVSNFLRFTAGAFGASLMTTAWDWRASFHRSRLVESIVSGSLPLREMQDTFALAALTPGQRMAAIDRMIEQQAHTLAVNDLFYLSALGFIALLGVLWVARWDPALKHH